MERLIKFELLTTATGPDPLDSLTTITELWFRESAIDMVRFDSKGGWLVLNGNRADFPVSTESARAAIEFINGPSPLDRKSGICDGL